jgi:hypothetical protein
MAVHWNCRFGHVLAGLLLAITGCAPLVIETNPDTFRVAADAASQLRGPQSVALNNAYQTAKQETIFHGGPTWTADLKQFTDTAITMLGREMSNRGVNVASPAAKTVTLRVHSVEAGPAMFIIRSSLVLEAEYGDGTKSSIRTENSSPSDAWRAVSGALMFAVTRLLRDEQFLAYVNR